MDQQYENQSKTQKENKAPDYRISLVRETAHGDVWADIGRGWSHKDSEGITFTPDLLKLFGLKLVARKIEQR
ncbi:MAG: hypothetical protein AAF551_04465 [Bacteroidota bacterium]